MEREELGWLLWGSVLAALAFTVWAAGYWLSDPSWNKFYLLIFAVVLPFILLAVAILFHMHIQEERTRLAMRQRRL
jgi:hypothetical protein